MTRKRYSFKEINGIVIKQNNTILSKPVDFKNTRSRLLLECNDCGFQRYTVVKSIIEKGARCKPCSSKKQRNSYEKTQKIISDMGFILLSDRHSDFRISSKLKIMCQVCDQVWFPTLPNLRKGTGCPKCSIDKRKYSFEYVKETIEQNNGVLLTECKAYKNSKTKLKVKCNICKYIWSPIFATILRENWCPKCVRKAPPTYNNVKKFIEQNNGVLLSKEYINSAIPLTIKCDVCDKIWYPSWSNIQRGQWCPNCSFGKSAKKLFKSLNNIFPSYDILTNYSFNWLYNKKTKRTQHIDFYIDKLKLAIEYDGEQHFKPVNFGGISDERAIENFKLTKKRDKRKNQLISEHKKDIKYFIRIPYTESLDTGNIKNILVKNNIIKEKIKC